MVSTLILLHGALGSGEQMESLQSVLTPGFSVHRFTFSGHGGKPSGPEAFSIPAFGEEITAFMKDAGIERASFFGHSMGGYVAFYLAKTKPDRVNRIFTLGTKFEWTPELAARETAGLNPAKIGEKVPKFARLLEERHAPNSWEELVTKTAALLTSLGDHPPLNENGFKEIKCPVCIGIGSEDHLVSVEESARVARLLPNGSLHPFTGMQHPLEKTDTEVLANAIRTFMT